MLSSKLRIVTNSGRINSLTYFWDEVVTVSVFNVGAVSTLAKVRSIQL